VVGVSGCTLQKAAACASWTVAPGTRGSAQPGERDAGDERRIAHAHLQKLRRLLDHVWLTLQRGVQQLEGQRRRHILHRQPLGDLHD
jgi:hypothetical protein